MPRREYKTQRGNKKVPEVTVLPGSLMKKTSRWRHRATPNARREVPIYYT